MIRNITPFFNIRPRALLNLKYHNRDPNSRDFLLFCEYKKPLFFFKPPPVFSINLPNIAFHTISIHSSFIMSTHGDTHLRLFRRNPEQCHPPPFSFPARCKDFIIRGFSPKNVFFSQLLINHTFKPSFCANADHYFVVYSSLTVNFLRTFALLLFNTSRPAVVDILSMKPCLFRRFRLLG